MNTKTINPNYEAFFTVKAEDVEPEYTFIPAGADDLNEIIRVELPEDARVCADVLASCLKQAIRQVCGFCLRLNHLSDEKAGEVCPFNPVVTCDPQHWKNMLDACMYGEDHAQQ